MEVRLARLRPNVSIALASFGLWCNTAANSPSSDCPAMERLSDDDKSDIIGAGKQLCDRSGVLARLCDYGVVAALGAAAIAPRADYSTELQSDRAEAELRSHR